MSFTQFYVFLFFLFVALQVSNPLKRSLLGFCLVFVVFFWPSVAQWRRSAILVGRRLDTELGGAT